MAISSSKFILPFLIVILFRANGASFLSPGHRPGSMSIGIPRANGARYRGTPDHAAPYRSPSGRQSVGGADPGHRPGLRDIGPLGHGCCEFIPTTPPVHFCLWRSRLRNSYYISSSCSSSAPTAHHSSAQGNALGSRPPESGAPTVRDTVARRTTPPLIASLQAAESFAFRSQGDALG